MDISPKNRYVISLVVPDRPGILRDITATVTDLGANIDGISQTVVAGYFTVLLTAFFGEGTGIEPIRSAIGKCFAGSGAELIITPCRASVARSAASGDRYVVTLTGLDSRGILKAATTFMAERSINIEDWYVTFNGDHVTHLGEISVPERLDIGQLQTDLREALASFNLRSCMHHENIFRAMQEITPIKPLLQGAR